MTQHECIETLCKLQHEVTDWIVGYKNPTDCFCDLTKIQRDGFKNCGKSIRVQSVAE